ncbi:MFS transporter [Acrocarpospora catenulata]|uniref:MFS transporter n=1 Tax=Acrocarpospora catenulata TaxID=2836182 RepID=UPI001BDA927E|nr:MFS transporter [Acrocarpospora catenulata]
MRKTAAAAVFATALEWYDFSIYATAAALVFGRQFFPGFSGAAGTLAAFGTFAVGFVARPVGGIIAGHYGDKHGRKRALVGALVVMGAATFLIGLLPTYAAIGITAPILLIILRLFQGLGVGAQWGGAALLLTEHAPVKQRGFYGSLIQTGGIIGVAAGTGAFLLASAAMTETQFQTWGWRIPFLVGILLIGVGSYVQLKIEDTPVFTALRQKSAAAKAAAGISRTPLVEAVRHSWKSILRAAGSFFVVNVTYYILVSGMLDYGVTHLGLSHSTVLALVLLAGVTQIITLPLFGAVSDRRGRRKLYLVGTVLMALYAFPMFWLIDTGSPVLMFLALTVAFTIHATMFGPQPALFAEMFPANIRMSAASLGYQIGSVFAGGLAPFIMVNLLATTGASWSVALYIIACAAVTYVSVIGIKEHFQRNLYETDERR